MIFVFPEDISVAKSVVKMFLNFLLQSGLGLAPSIQTVDIVML